METMRRAILPVTLTFFLALLTGFGCSEAQQLDEDTYFPLPAGESEVIESEDQSFIIDRVVTGLENPWGMAFLPGGDLLITERPGRLRLVRNGELLPDPIRGVPDVRATNQGGLLDIALHPQYEENGWIYLTYSKPEAGETNTAVMRARLSGMELTDQEEIFWAEPLRSPGRHYGSRIVFNRDGYLFVSVGESGNMEAAQDLTSHMGTVIRLHDDGQIPEDNPFFGQEDALPEIWSFGHRNPQGMVLHPETGEIWSHEHGPRGGDEINIIERSENYGWPEVTFGINYNGTPITEDTARPGMRSPIHYWDPSIAPSGMAFVTGGRYPGWEGDLMSGALAFQLLNRNVINGRQVVHEERLLQGIGRVRDVRMGPDGFLYLAVESEGAILRLLPAE